MAQLDARKAFGMIQTGLDKIVTEVKAMLAAGQVAKVFKGDLAKEKNKKYLEFLAKNNLISEDPAVAKKRGGGGRGGELAGLIKKVAGAKYDQYVALVKEINTMLEAAKAPVALQPYNRSLGTEVATPAAPPKK